MIWNTHSLIAQAKRLEGRGELLMITDLEELGYFVFWVTIIFTISAIFGAMVRLLTL